ncbi:alcohol dehydrogenase [Lactiplantibacillus pentosus]|uniref:Alcohol dehydrogenase n=2 Tax=Lactobacillaceae TaxID=33958 RepID=A0ABD7IPK7_LACPE|nr:alcohol dehydrogenase [Lactiplantibacillus pentosus]RMW46474.1 iron-containing alcohol dehydrogenase [Lactiplantibacillus pentosus]
MPKSVYAGEDLSTHLGEVINIQENRRVLLFTDKGIESNGLVAPIEAYFQQHDIDYRIEDEITPEPSYVQVKELLEKVTTFDFGTIVAIGGGSVMDAAKLISLLRGAPYTIEDLLDNASIAKKQVPSVMIPTTAGTGSEATINAIVTIPEKQVKFGIVSSEMLPDLVLLDVNNVKKLPKSILAASAVDALSHCVECYTSKNATTFSNDIAKIGARYIFQNIITAYTDPDNVEARKALLMGAFYGGVAITASGTTAVHALSYPLGGKFHIAHGVSNAILFRQVMELNENVIIPQLASMADFVYPNNGQTGAKSKADFLISKIANIVKTVEIPTDLHKFGVQSSDMDFLVDSALQQTRLLDHNMKKLSRADVEGIYRSVLN